MAKKDDRVRYGECYSCKKGKIRPKHSSKRAHCSDCDVWFDTSLTPPGVANRALSESLKKSNT